MTDKILLTQEKLKSILDYSLETGFFTWKNDMQGGVRKGDLAGCDNGQGYTLIGIGGKLYRAHRLAFLWVKGYSPRLVDHVNGERSDNRWVNLRECTFSENSMNYKRPSNNTSGVKGVIWDRKRGKWRARVSVEGKLKCFGFYKDLELAALVVCEARDKYHGRFSRHE